MRGANLQWAFVLFALAVRRGFELRLHTHATSPASENLSTADLSAEASVSKLLFVDDLCAGHHGSLQPQAYVPG